MPSKPTQSNASNDQDTKNTYSRFPKVNTALYQLCTTLVDQYISQAWLHQVTPNRDATRSILNALAIMSRNLEERILATPWTFFFLLEVPALIDSHYAAFHAVRMSLIHAFTSPTTNYHQPVPDLHQTYFRHFLNPHQTDYTSSTQKDAWPTTKYPSDSLTPSDALFIQLLPHTALTPHVNADHKSNRGQLVDLNDHLRTLSAIMLDILLPNSSLEADAERILLREIVAGVLAMIVDTLSDPVLVLRTLVQICQPYATPHKTAPNSSIPPPQKSWIGHSVWSVLTSISRCVWYHTKIACHTLSARLYSFFYTLSTQPNSPPPRPFWSTRHQQQPIHTIVPQADAILLQALNSVFRLSSTPATHALLNFWYAYIRPPLRFFMGSWMDQYLAVMVLYPWTQVRVASMIDWVRVHMVMNKEQAHSTPPPSISDLDTNTSNANMRKELRHCVETLCSVLNTITLRDTLTNHTARCLTSRFRNRHLLVRLLDTVSAYILVTHHKLHFATRSGGRYRPDSLLNMSPGADALALTSRNPPPLIKLSEVSHQPPIPMIRTPNQTLREIVEITSTPTRHRRTKSSITTTSVSSPVAPGLISTVQHIYGRRESSVDHGLF